MYVLDANVFITAKNLHYGMDFVPGFWEWLDRAHESKVLTSIEEVRRELLAAEDELSTWAAQRKRLFSSPDAAVVPSFRLLADWTHGENQYTAAAKATFLDNADFQLVAYAHAHDHTVVTHEKAAPYAKKRILIPDACAALGVPCVDPYAMLRSERARLVMAP